MEIFLLCVIIVLLLLMHAVKNAKLKNIETKISSIESYLKQVKLFQSKKIQEQETIENEKPIVFPVLPIINEVAPEVIAPVIPPAIVTIPDEKPIINNDQKNTFTHVHVESQQNTKVNLTASKTVSQPKISWYEKFRANNPDLEKFIGENILSKVAITILVIGVAFFVKYAIDKDWINEIARVGIGILCGGIVLGFAHHLHKNFKAFSSVLVAGGISIFYFTIGIAFHQYHIFNQTTAFILTLVITCFSVFISIIYNRQELAVLSLIGGFAAPFMVSTGQGNYLVFFSYILILDLGMLVLAYLRKWKVVNIFAYCLTTILYFSWLQAKVIEQPNPPYKGAFVFAFIFYFVFIMMNMINNIKEKRKFGAFDLSILISNTFLFYGEGMQILNHYHPKLQGIFSLGMAVFNLVCSWFLYKKFRADQRLVYLMIGLTLTFITLVAPVQLHGNYITLFWALESVLLVWLAQRSGIVMYRLVALIVSLLMGFSLIMDWSQIYIDYSEIKPAVLFNKAFITGIICSLSFLATAMLLKNETEKTKFAGITFNPVVYSRLALILFGGLLYLTGSFELLFQLNQFIYFGTTITIIVCAYHFLYFIILNVILRNATKPVQITLYIFNYVNVVLFVLVFAIFPNLDFEENVRVSDRGYLGFIFHYVPLICFALYLYFMQRTINPPNSYVKGSKILRTILVACAVVYVSSVELMVHILQFTIQATTNETEVWTKTEEIQRVETHIVKIGFPILWGLISFVFLYVGMKRQNKTLRIMSLILIAVILLKLFTYDIEDASEAGKIIAFIILGVVLLFISFMYQKIKKLIIDDNATLSINENETLNETKNNTDETI